ncbi:hypothetical protein G647_02120 [Cladophialophora carrionii CBS 160.54]|uniref:Peptidase A2 domain-containing protein n=1 Tax=Cladophialophora carrionii CBS 160.54 TaxID=1279043 RepID=V9DG82_9EURO|nr:uncharacterized protein G647_02120 [Cladophialophora carrionii CBS 160.54]ETI25348.1 hypothetical protein G647_02120 [Cladophialophora carrionii CBS 160.54]
MRLNMFVSLMFIHLRPDSLCKTPSSPSSTTPRRVLFDTGADFNLISHGAHAELDLSKQPYHSRVRSLGGFTELKSAVVLQWHFRSQTPKSSQQPPTLYRSSFYVLPPESDAKFDCILGRPWIEENWIDFIALVELNRKKDTD